MLRPGGILVGFLAVLGSGLALSAQERPGLALSLRIDNDVLQDQDDHYSSGIALHVVSGVQSGEDGFRSSLGAALGLRWPGSREVSAVGLQQALFTPQDITLAVPEADDAPYAGLLYASISLSGFDQDHLAAWTLHAGVIGPAAGAEWLQTESHELLDVNRPRGWDHQIGNEGVFAIAHERRWRSLRWGDRDGMGGDVLTGMTLAVGNLITAAHVATGVRIGQRVPDDFRMPGLFLGDATIGRSTATLQPARHSTYLFAMLDAHLLGYVAPWDGRITTSGGPSVAYDPYMFSGHLGLHVAFGRWDLTVAGILATIPHDTPNDRRYEGYARATIGYLF